jgi:hypothetical protein
MVCIILVRTGTAKDLHVTTPTCAETFKDILVIPTETITGLENSKAHYGVPSPQRTPAPKHRHSHAGTEGKKMKGSEGLQVI